jgi:hypothetical protein
VAVAESVGPILADIVEQCRRALVPRPLRVIPVYPGAEVAWDSCCEGQLWGRVVSIQPHTGANTGRSAAPPCGVLWWNVTVAVGILRCIATLNDAGEAPRPAALAADGVQMLADLTVIQQVLLWHDSVAAMIAWNPLGSQGGCGGGEWQATVRVGVCGCGPEATPH